MDWYTMLLYDDCVGPYTVMKKLQVEKENEIEGKMDSSSSTTESSCTVEPKEGENSL